MLNLKKLLKQKVGVKFDFDKKQGFSIPLDNWAKNGWYNSFKDDINNLPKKTSVIYRNYNNHTNIEAIIKTKNIYEQVLSNFFICFSIQ